MKTSQARADALRFLKSQTTAVVATVYRNLPYLATVYYLVDDDFNFHFITSKNTDKYYNLTANSNVALVVGAGPKHISVQARGHADIVRGDKRQQILDQIETAHQERHIANWPLKRVKRLRGSGPEENEIVFEVVPQHLVFLNLDDDVFPDSIKDDYHKIIPGV